MPKQVITSRPDDHELVTKGYFREELSEYNVAIAETLENFRKEMHAIFITKDDFYTYMDTMMGELKAIREEQAAGFSLLKRQGKRLDVLEKRVGIVS